MAEEDKHNNNKKKYKIKIMGEELVVNGKISEDYIQELAKYINKTGEEILDAYPRLPRRYLLSLILVNITDELFKMRNKYFDQQREKKKLLSYREKLEEKIKRLKRENK